jgi:hypothetical protein
MEGIPVNFPYLARIMLSPTPGHEIELTRFKRRPFPADIRHWTDGLCSPWWLEFRLPDKFCITERPKIRTGDRTNKLSLTREEMNYDSN